jgi:hypothetical protein
LPNIIRDNSKKNKNDNKKQGVKLKKNIMKTKKLIWIYSLLMSILFIAISCNKDKDDNIPSNANHYFAAGSYGDIIKYSIDNVNKKYKYTNETTHATDSGSYVLSTNSNLNGVYEISIGSKFYYGIELPNKMFATSLPSGNLQNALCFGITSETDLSTKYTASDFAGKYIWLLYQDIQDFQWGGYELFENGTYTWQYGPTDDNDFDENQHFAGAGSGTWEISSIDPTTIIFTENGINNAGSIYPGKFILIDNGVGQGFTAGIKYPDSPISQASIAGNYRWLDVTPEGYLGVGTFTLPASGTSCNYYYKYYNNPYASEGNETMTNFRRSTKIKNAFIGEDYWDGDLFYTSFIVLPGEALLFFTFGDNGMVSYGIAGKIN